MRTLLKGNQQSKRKQQPDNSATTSIDELLSTAYRYDKKFQDLVEEIKTERKLGYKKIRDSDRPNKLKVLYQQTCSSSRRRNTQATEASQSACALPSEFRWRISERSKEVQSKFGLSLACIYQQRHATSNEYGAMQRKPRSEQQREQQKLRNGQPCCPNSAKSSAKRRREEKIKRFGIEFETKMQLEQAQFERRKLELEMQIKELESKPQLLGGRA